MVCACMSISLGVSECSTVFVRPSLSTPTCSPVQCCLTPSESLSHSSNGSLDLKPPRGLDCYWNGEHTLKHRRDLFSVAKHESWVYPGHRLPSSIATGLYQQASGKELPARPLTVCLECGGK